MPSKTDFPVAASVREALDLVAGLPVPLPDIHTFPLRRAVDRVLAMDCRAPFAVPGFRRSRLDGFAARSEDLRSASPASPVTLQVIASVPAGTWPVPRLESGQCVRIMAGAPMPENADTVIGFENVPAWDDSQARFIAPSDPGLSVGRSNADASKGDLLAAGGARLDPVTMGRLAGVGVTNVAVFARPRIAVLSTGSELLLAGMPSSPGKIYNTNQTVICGILARHGALPLPCGIARDDPDAIAKTMTLAAQDSTMMITTGGVGQGDRDCILEAMSRAGAEILLAGARFRPGGNLALARHHGRYILSLSGAPGSALVTLALLGLPLARRLSGAASWALPEMDVILAKAPERKPQGILAGRLLYDSGQALFEPVSMRTAERSTLDLILPLNGDEDLELMTREKRLLRALRAAF